MLFHKYKVPSETKTGKMVNFRSVLLTRCQREFEKDCPSEKLLLAKRRKDIEDLSMKEISSKEEIDHETTKAKRRSLGNIRLMGELFKLKMLTENIMHDCVYKLLRTKDPENLELCCRLMTTIGKELDREKAKPRMDQYFNQMSKIINDKNNKPRVRFMLMDIMDLRTNKWVPRRVENIPKTIDQIHKEVAQEAQEKALISQQNQMAARSQGRGIGGGQGQNRDSKDDRNTVSSNRSKDRSIDPSKMNLSQQNVDKSAIKLGLGSGANRFAGWGRGSALNTAGIRLRWKEETSPKANTDFGINLFSQEPNTSTTWIQMINTERRTKEMLNDYFAGQDFEKAVKFVKEMPSQNHHNFVCFAFRIAQDRTSSDRKQTGLLLHDLIEHNVTHVDSFVKGLEEVLNHASYLKIDNPIWQFYGELISPLIQDGTVPLRSIKLAAGPLIARTKEVDVLDEITGGAVKRERFYEECLKHFMTT